MNQSRRQFAIVIVAALVGFTVGYLIRGEANSQRERDGVRESLVEIREYMAGKRTTLD